MQIASLFEGPLPTTSAKVNVPNATVIHQVVLEAQQDDPGWGSFARVTVHGPQARRRTMGRDETQLGGTRESADAPDPLLPQ
jgi:hypothetical protein